LDLTEAGRVGTGARAGLTVPAGAPQPQPLPVTVPHALDFNFPQAWDPALSNSLVHRVYYAHAQRVRFGVLP